MNLVLQFLLLIFATSLYSQVSPNTDYYRHLRYNHISPYADISGIHPIDRSTAKSTSHYVFRYNGSGKLVEIINNHYHTEKKHPLASIGVYRVVIEYSGDKETRTFYDPKGNRISNDRAVYKEVYSYDKNKFKSQLEFFDLNGLPMESNWEIASYEWTQNKNFVIERRYNLKKEMVNVSPYFEFGITGIELDEKGLPKAHYNLNEQLVVTNNSVGVASYRDLFDTKGNHVKYSYYNAKDSLTLNQWRFAVGQKSYDEWGNNILLEQFDTQGKLTRSRPIYSNVEIEISAAATAQDSIDIKKQSLGYLKALQALDPVLMNEVMNDSLNKVTIGYDRAIKKEVAKATTRDQMIAFAKDWNKSNTKFPPVPNNQLKILSIYNRIASVQLVSDNWVEYLHLIKLNEKWEIVNLIWQHKDINRYPK
ncbi:MAG: nuclear transport factor 2 family protein [Saprospiraceae bacterium]